MRMRERIDFLGASIEPWTMQETVREIADRLDRGEFTQHVVVNVAKLITMRNDVALRAAISACEIVNADGMGVVWGARILGLSIPERVAGVDLFFQLLTLASERGYPVYILGAKENVINSAVKKLRGMYPRLDIAGYHHGYFGEDEAAVVEEVRRSGAQMLFVAISSPKKEEFISKYREHLGVKFAMGIGGTIDIVAGVTKRAPRWMQRLGLEWLYRVLQEPRRMWKRYLTTNSIYAWLLLREKFRSFASR